MNISSPTQILIIIIFFFQIGENKNQHRDLFQRKPIY